MDDDPTGIDLSLGPVDLSPGSGIDPSRLVRSVTSVPQSVYPETSSTLVAPVSTTVVPKGTDVSSLAPAPGQPVNLTPPNPAAVGRPIATAAPVIPQGSIAPQVQGQQVAQATLPQSAPVPTVPPGPPQGRSGPMPGSGKGIAGSVLQPPVAANPQANPLQERMQNIDQEIAKSKAIADNPTSQFFFNSATVAAKENIAKLQKEKAEIQQTLQTQQTNYQLGKNLGLTKTDMPSTADAAAYHEEALREWKEEGNLAAYRGLVGAGQGARADLYKTEGMQALDNNTTKAAGLFSKLDTATNENEYQRLRADIMSKSDPKMRQFGLTEDKIPMTLEQYKNKRTLIQSPLNDASRMVAQFKTAIENQGVPQPIADEKLASAVTAPFKTANGDSIPNTTAVSLENGQRGAMMQPGSKDLRNFGITFNDMNKENRKEIREALNSEQEKGAINQYKMAKSFSTAAMNDKLYTTPAGVAFLADELGAIGRDVAEGSKAAGSVGLVRILESKYGTIDSFLNASTNNWAAYKAWVASGKQGEPPKLEPRLTPQSIQGFKDIAAFKMAETQKELLRIEGPIAQLGRNGGSLAEVGLDKDTQAALKDVHDKALMQGRIDRDQYPAIINGDRRILLPEGTTGKGVIPAGSYLKGMQDIKNQVAPPAPAAPAAAPGTRAEVPPAPGGGGYNPATYQAGISAGESGGNYTAPPNPKSGASGKYQFLDSTWAQNKPPGAPDQAYKATPEQQDAAFKTFTGKNAVALQSNGLPVNNFTLAVAHQQGAGGAKALLTAPDDAIAFQQVDRKAAAANPQFFWNKDRPLTVAESKAKFAQFYRTGPGGGESPVYDTSKATGASAPTAQPGVLSRLNQMFTQGVQGSGPQGRATPAEATAAVVKPVAAMAPGVAGTAGAIGGGVVGGLPGALVGGAAGGAAGGALSEYLTKPEGQTDYPTAMIGGAGQGVIAGIPGAGVLPTVARIAGGGTVAGGTEALRGGTTGEVFNAAVGGVLGAAGGEAFGQALGMAGHLIYNRFSGAAKSEIQSAAKVLAEQEPKKVLADGKSVENVAYTNAKKTVTDAGIDAEHAAYAYNQVTNKATKGEALTQRPGAVEAAKAGQELQKVQGFVGNTAAAQNVLPKSPAPGAPAKFIPGGPAESLLTGPSGKGTVPIKYQPEAVQAEYMLQKPAANMYERWGNAAEARSTLLAHERDALNSTAPDRTERANAMRHLADTVRDQQEKMVRTLLPKNQADALISHLKVADTRYQNAMKAGGPDIVSTIAKGDAKGNQAKAAFDALAHDDPAARRMMTALTTAQNRAGDKAMLAIAATSTGLLHFIPVVGTAASIAAGAVTAVKVKQMAADYMARRGAGQMVKFSDLVGKEFPSLAAKLRPGSAAVGAGAGIAAMQGAVAPSAAPASAAP